MTTGWTDQPLTGFDLETTGEDPAEARIVTAALVTIKPGQAPVVDHWLADPGIDIPDEAAAIHGITTEHAREHGQPLTQVVNEVTHALADAWTSGPVIAYNANYDLTVMHHECARLGIPFAVAGPVIDPYIIDKALDRHRRGRRVLAATCAHYRVTHDGAHDSTTDALAAIHLALRLARAYPRIGRCGPGQLHDLTIRWHVELQLSYADYLTRKKAHALAQAVRADANGWPVRQARITRPDHTLHPHRPGAPPLTSPNT